MKLSALVLASIFLLTGCRKNEHTGFPAPTSSPDDHAYLGRAKVVAVDLSCSYRPTLIETVGGSFGYPAYYQYTTDSEFWTYHLPDSLKAVGQELEIRFIPQYKDTWLPCWSRMPPNQIEITWVNPLMVLEYVEIIDVSTTCKDLVLAKVHPYLHYGKLIDQAYCVNLPDSLKSIGRRIKAWSRFAGANETITCNGLRPIAQITLSEPEPW